jgi:imidazolonepropionase-like amidohydrolase
MCCARGRTAIVTLALVATAGCGRSSTEQFVRPHAPVLALTHVRVIDGTGRPAIEDQALVVQDERISAVGPTGTVALPATAEVLDLSGRTVMPGLVGMHEHLFYEVEPPSSGRLTVMPRASFSKLYLAAGVTTIRTAGTVDLEGDVEFKRLVDAGREVGPKIHVTGPYLGAVGATPHASAVAQQVVDAASAGATSFKAYRTLRPLELHAAIQAAHARRLRITGHLCAVGFREAADLGIDNLEHGLYTDTEFYSRKTADSCPEQGEVMGELLAMKVSDAAIQRTIQDLVRHRVAITSTLAVTESFTGREAANDSRVLPIFSPRLLETYRAAREPWSDPQNASLRGWAAILTMEMQFERAFAAAGGRLLAGVDPTGWGGVIAGFGDQRQLELLVEAGFRPEAAIQIATANGAAFLGEPDIGTIAAGNKADLVIVRGDPSARISDVRNVEIVFKDGVAYDSAQLIESTRGSVTNDAIDFSRIISVWPWNAVIGTLVLLLAVKVLWRRSRERY